MSFKWFAETKMISSDFSWGVSGAFVRMKSENRLFPRDHFDEMLQTENV